MRVAVVGGGLAGLAAAHRLRSGGAEVVLLETGDRVGGVCRTLGHDGFLVDLGPNTVVARTPLLPELIAELELGQRVVRAPEEASTRFIVRDGRPVPLPTSPASLVRTPLFSLRGKLRALGEPLVPRGRRDEEETVAAFVRRRFGSDVLDYAVDPFVSGVYAGDPERLILRHAFPMVGSIAEEHQSLFVGGLKRARRGGGAGPPPDRRPLSFRGGIEELPAALARSIGEDVRLGTRVMDVLRTPTGFSITVENDAGAEELSAGAVVLALPPDVLAGLSIVPGAVGTLLRAVPVPPVAVLGLGFRREQVEHPLAGFGLLVPGREPFRLLGVLFSSSMFPGRAPEEHVLVTCFLGGRRKPEDALLDEEAQLALVLPELGALLGVEGRPVVVIRQVWPLAIPQYERGYGRLLDGLRDLEAQTPGLAIAGNVRGGISVGDVLAGGVAAAERVLEAAGG